MNVLEQDVNLINEGKAIVARWDGKEYKLTKTPIVIRRGIAEHWKERHKEAKLRVEEIVPEEAETRTPGKPLEDNNRGEAFASLKNAGE